MANQEAQEMRAREAAVAAGLVLQEPWTAPSATVADVVMDLSNALERLPSGGLALRVRGRLPVAASQQSSGKLGRGGADTPGGGEAPLQYAICPVLPLLAEIFLVGLQQCQRLGPEDGVRGGLVLQHGGAGQEGGVLWADSHGGVPLRIQEWGSQKELEMLGTLFLCNMTHQGPLSSRVRLPQQPGQCLTWGPRSPTHRIHRFCSVE